MDEDGKNISDDISSLLHAAEEWADERLLPINSSHDFDNSISYPIHVPVEEVAGQVALELCKIYNWDPETGADRRLLRRNASDTTSIQQSSEVASSAKHVEYHEQDILPDIFQQPDVITFEDNINKTYTVKKNPLNKKEQLDKPAEVIHNNVAVSFNTTKVMNVPNQIIHDDNIMNKTLACISPKMTKELDKPNQVTQDNLKQKLTMTEKIAMLSVPDTISSLTAGISYGSKIITVNNAERNTYISPNDNCPGIMNQNEMSNAEGNPQSMKQKFFSVASEELAVNCAQDTTLFSGKMDCRELPDNNLTITIPHTKSPKETQKTSEITNSGSNDINEKNIIAYGNGNIVNSHCSTDNDDVIITTANFSFPAVETSIFTDNEINRSTVSKVDEIIKSSFSNFSPSATDTKNITNLPENDISIPKISVIANITPQQFSQHSDENKESLMVINSTEFNSIRNDHCALPEENRALIIELNNRLNLLQNSIRPSQTIIQEVDNQDLISSKTTKQSEKYLLTVPANLNLSPAVKEIKNNAMMALPNINNSMQTESSTYLYDRKNYANLETNIDAENASKNQLIISNEITDPMTNVNDERIAANNQTQFYLENHLDHLEKRCKESKEFQTDAIGKEFITRSIKTDQKNENESDKIVDDKLNSSPNGENQINTAENTSFNKSLTAINSFKNRSFLDEPIKFFNYLSSSARRKSCPSSTKQNPAQTNKFSTRAGMRAKTVREILKTPTIMTSDVVRKLNIRQNSGSVHSTGRVNPPKKPNRLPLETRASRLKANYLAKERAEKENGWKLLD
uniref:Bm10588 n=1 Tax=Brugia malayi TaxID=6279 RepID=A0A1I9GC76_BRUMA|nr:Bm10588 [Brugia malayi]